MRPTSTGSTESSSMMTTDGAASAHALLLVQQYGGAEEDRGRRILLEQRLQLGRDNPLFSVSYPKLSRQHADLEVEDEHVRVVDRESRHGTFVQGRRIEQVRLEPGELLEAGGVGFLLVRAPATFVPPRYPQLAFASYDFARALHDATIARESRRPIVIVGEHGVGKSAIAEEIVGDATDAIVFDRLDEADEEAQRELLLAVREAESDAAAPRVIVLTREAPEELAQAGRLLPSLVSYLDTWVIEVPPLRMRPEDILPIVHHHLSALAPGEAWSVHRRLARRLLRNPWLGNVRALLAEIERLQLIAEGRQLVDSPEGAAARRTRGVCRISLDASWLEDPSGQRVELGGRRMLRGVLHALVVAHLRDDDLLPPSAIAEQTWPGESMLPRAALNRVYVAVANLRKLGLGGAIEHVRGGYRFVVGSVEIVS